MSPAAVPGVTPAEVAAALANSALRYGGTPRLNEVADQLGLPYRRVQSAWRRMKERAEVGAAKIGAGAPPAPPPPPRSAPPPTRELRVVDAAKMTQQEFWQWRVEEIQSHIDTAVSRDQWPAVAALNKALHDARDRLEVFLNVENDPEKMTSEEFLEHFEVAMADAPEDAWDAIARALQQRIGVVLLVPATNGGPSMRLGRRGWERSGPEIQWRPEYRVPRSA